MKRLQIDLPLGGLSFREGERDARPPFSVDWIRSKILGDGALAGLNTEARCILLGAGRWALELAPLGIRVYAVAAGPTASAALTGMIKLSRVHAVVINAAERKQIPLKRRGTPDDVAG